MFKHRNIVKMCVNQRQKVWLSYIYNDFVYSCHVPHGFLKLPSVERYNEWRYI